MLGRISLYRRSRISRGWFAIGCRHHRQSPADQCRGRKVGEHRRSDFSASRRHVANRAIRAMRVTYCTHSLGLIMKHCCCSKMALASARRPDGTAAAFLLYSSNPNAKSRTTDSARCFSGVSATSRQSPPPEAYWDGGVADGLFSRLGLALSNGSPMSFGLCHLWRDPACNSGSPDPRPPPGPGRRPCSRRALRSGGSWSQDQPSCSRSLAGSQKLPGGAD